MNNRISLEHTRVIQPSDDAHSHTTSNKIDAKNIIFENQLIGFGFEFIGKYMT